MQAEEQRLIEGLFNRLKQVEQSSRSRDSEADQHIQKFIQQQPAAPYYMAQSILIQEAALNRLNQQVQQLQNKVAQLQAAQQQASRGRGFLSWLFGRCRFHSSPPSPQPTLASAGYNIIQPQCSNNIPRGGSFMSGALQTAAGVASGVVLGNMLTHMFHHSSYREIINMIDDPTTSFVEDSGLLLTQDFDACNLDIFNKVSESHFFDQNDALSNNKLDTADFSNDDLDTDDFSNDDDGFI
ncbi:DUF2076 domain-containing protein [Candidatus Hoaglandella endobia]|uniref:Periplasmic ligand-binding sensor protein n=1 Tax=Candidatus Hoaglandella endobia TaxID=1778263 RepID=A0A143WU69_9ENTR|nr:DUF2076 domain-containing protein [Candidatus Hoaglandella endobia]CUX97303.1 hypothetical protein TPER_HE00386 [Candidatus Hoaglandella endobia]